MKLFSKLFLFFFLINTLLLVNGVSAQSEEKPSTEEKEDDIPLTTEAPADEDLEFDENGWPKLKPHPDIDTIFKFTKPDNLVALELPSRQEVQFLIGVKNKGNKDFVIETIDASLRYPQDFSANVQNFTSYIYNRIVKPNQEVTMAYSFMISDLFNERLFGFLVNLLYRDADGKLYSSAVFNQTLNIVELNDGFNGEILFVYVFLISLVGGILTLIYKYFLARRFFSSKSKRKIETGTVNSKIDYSWIPNQNLSNPKSNDKKNSPKPTSPNSRKAKKVD